MTSDVIVDHIHNDIREVFRSTAFFPIRCAFWISNLMKSDYDNKDSRDVSSYLQTLLLEDSDRYT